MARSGSRKVARYGDHFKAAAVKLSNRPEVLIQDVAAALEIHPLKGLQTRTVKPAHRNHLTGQSGCRLLPLEGDAGKQALEHAT